MVKGVFIASTPHPTERDAGEIQRLFRRDVAKVASARLTKTSHEITESTDDELFKSIDPVPSSLWPESFSPQKFDDFLLDRGVSGSLIENVRASIFSTVTEVRACARNLYAVDHFLEIAHHAENRPKHYRSVLGIMWERTSIDVKRSYCEKAQTFLSFDRPLL